MTAVTTASNKPPTIDDYALRTVRYHARKLVRTRAFEKHEREDLEQDLTLHLLERLDKFSPERAQWETFVEHVISHKALDLLRQRQREQRKPQMLFLEPLVHDLEARDTHERECLSLDLAAVLKSLPPDLQDLCERLKFQSISEIAKETGTPRTTLNYAIGRLREHFEKAGLHDYL